MRTETITSRLQKALWPAMLLSLACGMSVATFKPASYGQFDPARLTS